MSDVKGRNRVWLVHSMWALLSSHLRLGDTSLALSRHRVPRFPLIPSPRAGDAGRLELRAYLQTRLRPSVHGGWASPPPTSSSIRPMAPQSPSRVILSKLGPC